MQFEKEIFYIGAMAISYVVGILCGYIYYIYKEKNK
ncbi:hypothetical protein KEN49_CDS0115 [Pseudomonas phage vB_Pae3705-KEN49]